MTFAALLVTQKRDRFPIGGKVAFFLYAKKTRTTAVAHPPLGKEKTIPHPTCVGSSLCTKEPSNVLRTLLNFFA